MQILDRLKTGVTLTVDSLSVMRHNPKLALFPIVSGVAGLTFLALFLGITFGLMAIDPQGGVLVGMFLIYLVLTFISSFFTAGLVHQTREVLAGTDPSLRAGLDAAWDEKWSLLAWALVSATIGVIINGIENSDSRVARLFGTIFGAAWTLLTFFVIPVIVFEETSFRGMFTESAKTFKDVWGETPISLIAVQVISAVVIVPFAILAYLLLSINTVLAIGVGLIGVLLAFLVAQTFQGIIKTTLYIYATEGTMPEEFDNVDLDDLTDSNKNESATGVHTPTGGFR